MEAANLWEDDLKTKGGDYKERYLAPEARRALECWLEKAHIRQGDWSFAGWSATAASGSA